MSPEDSKIILSDVNELQDELDHASDVLIEAHLNLKAEAEAYKAGDSKFTIQELEERVSLYLLRLDRFSIAAGQLAVTKAQLGIVGKSWYKADANNNEEGQ